jgi:hypothetical protein
VDVELTDVERHAPAPAVSVVMVALHRRIEALGL